MAKAANWAYTDTERRKRGEQTGLDTLVGPRPKRWSLVDGELIDAANALNDPPE